ncbi:MAG: LCP family protein, partial [Anaerovorax sp.]
MKRFFKTFVIAFIVAVLGLIPVNWGLEQMGQTRIFTGEANLMRDMGTLVNKDSEFFQQFQDSKRVNILVTGINGNMTDTIMLGSYDMKNQRVDVISIPRDTYYPRTGYNNAAQKKINAIYSSEGIVPFAEAISDVLFGMPINYYVIVEYDDVGKIVDAIGGVPVTIPFDMDYYDPYDKPPLKIHFKEGPTVLNGTDAIKYLRYRKDDKYGYGYAQGDIGRVAAQQAFIKSAFKEALGFSLPKVAKTTMETVESDLDLKMAIKIATHAAGLQATDMKTWTVEGESGTKDNASYWF